MTIQSTDLRQHTPDLLSTLMRISKSIPDWMAFMRSLSPSEYERLGIHLAIFTEPYLGFVLDGRKTIDSRFSVHRIAPFNQVGDGDIILLKRAGGPVVGICQAGNTWFYKLDPDSFADIVEKFGKAICPIDQHFWDDRRHAGYATLIRLERVTRIAPFALQKKDRRGWVVLKQSPIQTELTMPPVVLGIAGPIACGKTAVGSRLADFLECPFASFGHVVRSTVAGRGLEVNRENLQHIGQELVDSDAIGLCQNVLKDAGWRPGLSAVIDGIRHTSVLEALRSLVQPLPFKLIFVDVDVDTQIARTGFSASLLSKYQRDATEIQLPTLKKLADICISGSAPLEENLKFLRNRLVHPDGT